MKRLAIFKNASDFAFSSLATTDPIQLDIDSANAFKSSGLPADDYNYWKQSANQCRMQFQQLAQQPAPSEQMKQSQPKIGGPQSPAIDAPKE